MVDIPVTATGAMLISTKVDHSRHCKCDDTDWKGSGLIDRGVITGQLTKNGPWIQEADDWVRYNVWYDLD